MEWYFEGPLKGDLVDKENKNESTKKNWTTIGFPGWHVECSAMSMIALGPTLDIHTGGIDHIPIHHTNEIAQSEAVTGKVFSKYWVHHAFLLVEGEKMSKSLENFYTVEDIVKKGFSPIALRYLYLQTHYRHEMNFTWEALKAAQTALDRLYEIASNLPNPGENLPNPDYEGEFCDAINNDLDMPKAISIMWEMIRTEIPDNEKIATIYKMDNILGLKIKENVEMLRKGVPSEIMMMVKTREDLRKQKKFGQADQLRVKIEKKGYIIKDTGKETKVVKKF